MWVGEEEKARTGIHLKGQRNVGKLILRATKCVHTKNEITMIISASVLRVGQCATNIKTTTDEPIEAIAASCLIHEIGVEGEHNRNLSVFIKIVKDETVAQVELDGEVVGGEGFEGGAIHKADGTTDGIVVRGYVAANLSHRNRA